MSILDKKKTVRNFNSFDPESKNSAVTRKLEVIRCMRIHTADKQNKNKNCACVRYMRV